MADKDKDNSQNFSFDTVAVLVATIIENGGNLGTKEFKRMSALDGSRGEHGFNHMFRKVKARAKEITDQAKADDDLTPVKKTKGAGAGGSAAKKTNEGTGGKKRARKSKKGEEAGDKEKGEDSPSKKVKADLEPESEEAGEADVPAEPSYEFEY